MNQISFLSEPKSVSMDDAWFSLTDPGHFFFEWRFEVLKKMISPLLTPDTKILEIGCGDGLVMQQCERHLNLTIDGCDLNAKVMQEGKSCSGKMYVYDIFDLDSTMVGKYDIVLMMDVLEHIPDDAAFFKAACAHLKPGGHIIVGVPANAWMYSKYDQVVGHFRRYSPKGLRNVFFKNDTKVLRGSFWGLSLVPISILRKFWLLFVGKEKIVSTGFKPPSPLFNSIFLWLMRLELTFFPKPPLGISYMIMGKIEDNHS